VCNIGIGEAHLNLSDHDLAVRHSRQAIALCRQIGNREGDGTALVLLGRSLSAVGDSRGCDVAMRYALDVLAGIGNTGSELAQQACKALVTE
jgi:hypothetical protein